MIEKDIAKLICGQDVQIGNMRYMDSDYLGLFDLLSKEISSLSGDLYRIISGEIESDEIVYPYLCRKFLELSATTLLARVDPIRVLSARKHQKSADYSTVDRNYSAIQWTGDILPQNPPPKAIWSNDAFKGKLERSLLGWHFKDLYFSFGFEWILDSISANDSAWVRDISTADSGFDFVKSRLNKLYSKLSKGVHSEYLVEDRVVFDRGSLEVDICETIMLVIILALALNISPLVLRSLEPELAIDIAARVERAFLEHKGQI